MESNTEKRRGYKFKLQHYDNLQVYPGTVDINDPKTIYIDLHFWGFRQDQEARQDVSKKFTRIKKLISQTLPKEYFYDTFISILDFPDNIGLYDKFFVKIQFTLYVKKTSVKNKKQFYEELLKPLLDDVYKQEFEGISWIKQRRH